MSNVSQKYLTDENNNKFSPVASTNSVYGDGVGGGQCSTDILNQRIV